MLLIRADGNQNIGMGHVMRCLSIADAAIQRGHAVLFVTADDTMSATLQGRGYDSLVLGTDYRKMEAEIDSFHNKIVEWKQDPEKQKITNDQDWIIIDSYQASNVYLRNLKQCFPASKIAILDDMFSYDYETDCVINYNIYGEAYPFHRPGQLQLLGCRFAPLRQQFLDAIKMKAGAGDGSRNSRKHAILVSTGGADSLHIAEAIIKACVKHSWEQLYQRQESLFLHVVCGAMNPNRDALLQLEYTYPELVKIHVNVQDMAGLMQQCEMAVTAAGSTVYELSALGIPFATYYFVENQRRMAEHCGQKLGICNAGDYSKEPDLVLQKLMTEIEALCLNEQRREDMAQHLLRQVDGKGALRIIEMLEKSV